MGGRRVIGRVTCACRRWGGGTCRRPACPRPQIPADGHTGWGAGWLAGPPAGRGRTCFRPPTAARTACPRAPARAHAAAAADGDEGDNDEDDEGDNDEDDGCREAPGARISTPHAARRTPPRAALREPGGCVRGIFDTFPVPQRNRKKETSGSTPRGP